MKMIPEVGDTVTVKGYCYTNEQGGTSIAEEKTQCKITKAWDDYECGWRYWATPLNGKHKVIYVGQFDIVEE